MLSDVPSWFFATAVVLMGLVVGSFLNVVVWRVPRGESIVQPPSACPVCAHPIRPRDNVPVLSWLLLRRRCRDCSTPISARYPTVELTTGALFGLTYLWSGLTWALPGFLYLASVSVALTLIDLDTRRLPNAIVLPAYPVGMALVALAAWNPGGPSDWGALARALIAGLAMYGVYFALMVIARGGMGFGDVKLAGVLGLFLGLVGWEAVGVGWFAAFLLGGLVAVVLVAVRGAGRKTAIPFGPFMIIGAAIGLVVGDVVAGWYLAAI